jgi:glutaminyl-peptide cyclotransferase
MRIRLCNAAALVVVIVWAAIVAAPGNAAVPEYTPVVVKSFPHDPNAFTEGLLYHDGFLYEATGRNGQSSIRKVVLATGAVVQQKALDPAYFGEGIDVWKNRLIELTWKNEIGFIYDLDTFKQLGTFKYPGEGWALTDDGSHLIMSDGTSDLRILDPDTLAEIRRVHVTCEGRAIQNINELEWVKGQVYANVWRTNVIIRIDPASGDIVGLIDLTDLAAATVTFSGENVPNGIAYDAAADRLFVTGKLWPKLYQITLAPRQDSHHLCQALPP